MKLFFFLGINIGSSGNKYASHFMFQRNFFLALSSIWLLGFLSDLGFSCSVQLAFYYYNTFCEVGRRNYKNVGRKLNAVVAS